MTAGTWRQRNGRWISFAVRLVLLAAVAGAALWWFKLAPVAVAGHTAAAGTVRAEVLGTGTLEARVSALVGPKIGGRIVAIAADQGDRVAAGDVLFQLEDRDLRQQVGIAEAEVAAAAATLERARASQRGVAAVLAQTRLAHARVAELIANEILAQQDLDKAFEAVAVAEAESAVANAAEIEARKRLDAAERTLDYQRARLADTTVEAPFDGLIVRRDREAGDVVAAGSSVLLLASTEEMWIAAWVDETELARLAVGQPARVVFRSEPAAAYAGTVARIGRETDRETRELVVEVRVDGLPANWAVGQRAEVYVEVARREAAIALPAGLVLVRDGRSGVVVDDAGRARWREITLGLRGRDTVEVTAGLAAGEIVVSPAAPGAAPLRDGRRLRRR